MERHFDEDLKSLKEQILRMGSAAEEMTQKAVKALVERDGTPCQEVFEIEKSVNQMHIDIDEFCIRLVALHQPMAVDLRFITACMKINSDLERIGDCIVNIGQTLFYHYLKEPPIPQSSWIVEMGNISQKMLKDSLDAFSKKDIQLAQSVLEQDEEQNRLKSKTLHDCIELLHDDPKHSKQLVDLILLSKNMERIGDHATNVAEDVIFMVKGKDIRHHLKEDK